jgi:hypothetical protein
MSCRPHRLREGSRRNALMEHPGDHGDVVEDHRAISADILEFCARVLVILAARGAINE